MYIQMEKSNETMDRGVAHSIHQKHSGVRGGYVFADNRSKNRMYVRPYANRQLEESALQLKGSNQQVLQMERWFSRVFNAVLRSNIDAADTILSSLQTIVFGILKYTNNDTDKGALIATLCLQTLHLIASVLVLIKEFKTAKSGRMAKAVSIVDGLAQVTALVSAIMAYRHSEGDPTGISEATWVLIATCASGMSTLLKGIKMCISPKPGQGEQQAQQLQDDAQQNQHQVNLLIENNDQIEGNNDVESEHESEGNETVYHSFENN
ncbi:hypothetical protein PRUB_a0101 [Pseudoalteromonas rubra]|uniref:Uncharacterized protein n=1 Tax=Pseudoalteromonas rubra TaxID=43658 RepID=A0A8T0C535_9GAMM|nr:hypothetical protein [Pseudoalteromonas rubra]KAF7785730.1 hypothetical protein PRUB_a0101 [Pseudoalteromonas rubra]